ncbi:Holliday junction ATP-dependent DNA helicase RuvA [Candidatus Hydrogenisulfobacillus filiaventi]|uniref:Holliday junction branch migration complex subunit RuvA n=1 Tax=Candidatus Hydrogenisulfobacillus filiaventi TaxID=2707344 RepID=A0A6F8ZG32_9FIRM|nr:Holliday junction branch migration protein RuvA [Bacillota bacterium]CAB1128422.1 Holliday junction ATP-dependent DNA helicase RuvA [Candidatus Hydrogenisulfobacillus filiaventi]
MIVELWGTLRRRGAGEVVVEAGGVGYGVHVSERTLAALPEPGQPVHLFTHLLVREDGWVLAGFASEDERRCFLDLLAVSGVGLRMALAVLSRFDPAGLEATVREGDWKRLTQVPGVGPKTARRLQLELAGRWRLNPAAAPAAGGEGPAPESDEVVAGLMALGYELAEAQAAARDLPAEWPAEERMREALRRLDRGLPGPGTRA